MIEPLSRNELASLDALNSWVRSDSHRHTFNSPKYAIYEWKRLVIKAAIKAGQAECHAIYLGVTCRDCGGSGRYTDAYGEKYPHCRKCSSTGNHRLTFFVTQIGDIKWHTPFDKSNGMVGYDGWKRIYESASLSTDWEPNTKGKDLTTSEVAGHLNVLEPRLWQYSGSRWIYYDSPRVSWDSEDVKNGRYKLYLGRSAEVCEFCKSPSSERDGIGHHVSRQWVEWTAWACNACKALYATHSRWSDAAGKYVPAGGNGKSIFDEFVPPAQTDPEICRWLERRQIIGAGDRP